MERLNIFIDAGNFYHIALKKVGVQELGFDFEKFVRFLANGRIIADMGKRFYVGTVREKEGDIKSKEAMSRQTTLFAELTKLHWQIKTSKLKRRLEELVIDSRVVDYEKFQKVGIEKVQFERLREKGIDVKLATDLIVGAVDNQYDTAIIISSDSDLLPAIDWVRRRYKGKKKIEYIGFSIPDEYNLKNSTEPSLSLIAKTDIQRILVKSDLEKFIKPSLFNKKNNSK